MSDLNKLVNKWRANGGAMEQAADELERVLSAQGEAVAVVTIAGYPQWLVEWLESPGYRYLPEGTKLYTHPAPRVEVDPEDIVVESFPSAPSGGMSVGMPAGVKVTHKPTGCTVTVSHYRSQHHNRAAAIAALTAALNPSAEVGRG